MSAHTYISGVGGTVTFNSIAVDVASWQLNDKVKLAETTNTGGGGAVTRISTVYDWSANVKLFWDTADVPTTAAAGPLIPGQAATLSLLVGTGGRVYTGSAIVESAELDLDPSDVTKYNVVFQGNSLLTRPT